MPECCAEEVESVQFLADVVSKPRKCHVSGVQTFARHSFVLVFPAFLPLYLLANFFSMLVVGKPFFCNGPYSCHRPCISEGGCLWIDAAAKLLPSCLTLCNLMYCSPPGSSVHGILEARVWNGFLCSSLQDLPDPEIKPISLTSSALAGGLFTTGTTWEAPECQWIFVKNKKDNRADWAYGLWFAVSCPRLRKPLRIYWEQFLCSPLMFCFWIIFQA